MKISKLTPEQAPEAAALAQGEGLISVEAGWLRAHCAASPDLCWSAWSGSELVGISIASHFGSFVFLGPLAVASAHQGEGIGSTLLDQTIEAAAPVASLALEATEAGKRLYGRRGFMPRWTTARFHAERPQAVAEHSAQEGNFEKLASLDRRYTGGDRRNSLRLARDLYGASVLTVGSAAALVSENRLAPLLAGNQADAEMILDAASSMGVPLSCWAPERPEVVRSLASRGFALVEQAPRLIRMYRGSMEPIVPERILALLSLQAG